MSTPPTPNDESAKRRTALAEAALGTVLSAAGIAVGLHGFLTAHRWLLLTVSLTVFGYSIGVLIAAYHWYELTDVGRHRTRRAAHAIVIVIVAAGVIALLLFSGDSASGGIVGYGGKQTKPDRHGAPPTGLFVLTFSSLVALVAVYVIEVSTGNDIAVIAAGIAGLFGGALLGFGLARLHARVR